jgi:hypothetical protein
VQCASVFAACPRRIPSGSNLYENIQRLQFDVQRIAPLDGELQTMEDLRAAMGMSGATRSDTH